MKIYYLPFMNLPNCSLLDYIKKGIKTVEGRKYSPKYFNIQPEDIIIFKTKNHEDVYVKVIYVHKYKTLEDYLEKETIPKTIPCAKSFDEAVNIYNKMTTEDDRNYLLNKYGYGFLGIGIQLIDKNQYKYIKYKSKYDNLKRNHI